MDEVLQLALTILLVGMTSVFVVLSLVVLTGRVIISVTNRWAPAPEKVKGKPTTSSPSSKPVSNNALAAISAVVDFLTAGKGQVGSVKKVDPDDLKK